MNENYKDYNIIPIGDHCAISLILGELEIRKKALSIRLDSQCRANKRVQYNV
jgi:hypothetical protein